MAQDDPDTRKLDGATIAEQLAGTTTQDAGGNVSGTDDDAGDELEIDFEPESDDE